MVDCSLASLMANKISSSVVALNWSQRSFQAGRRLVGFVLGGGIGKSVDQSRLHLSWKLLSPFRGRTGLICVGRLLYMPFHIVV